MTFLGILVAMAAIGFMCWLLFNLAVFALPFFIGVNAGIWAYGTGAGWLGAVLVGLLAAGLTLAAAQGLLILVRPLWARLLIALAFVAILMVGNLRGVRESGRLFAAPTYAFIAAILMMIAVGLWRMAAGQ